MNLENYCGAGYIKPFTIKDPSNSVWTIATDKVWLVATKQERPYPRLMAGIDALNKVLNLIKTSPGKSVMFDTASALDTLGRVEERFVQVLGVTVERDRLATILKDFGDSDGVLWDASTVVGVPSLGVISKESRWFLTGWDHVDNFKSVVLEMSLEDLLY